MKIYQIHEYSGEYEHFHDYIVATYLDKSKAEIKMQELVDKNIEDCRCNECPIIYCPSNCNIENCDDKACDKFRTEEATKRCNRLILTYRDNMMGDDRILHCENYYHQEEMSYEIKEVEVIE